MGAWGLGCEDKPFRENTELWDLRWALQVPAPTLGTCPLPPPGGASLAQHSPPSVLPIYERPSQLPSWLTLLPSSHSVGYPGAVPLARL